MWLDEAFGVVESKADMLKLWKQGEDFVDLGVNKNEGRKYCGVDGSFYVVIPAVIQST